MIYTVTKIERIDNTIYAYLDNNNHIILNRMDLNVNRIKTKFGIKLGLNSTINISNDAIKDLIRVKMWK